MQYLIQLHLRFITSSPRLQNWKVCNCLNSSQSREISDVSEIAGMSDAPKETYSALEQDRTERGRSETSVQRQIALLTAIIRVFRETATCETEEEVAQICLEVAEELDWQRIRLHW